MSEKTTSPATITGSFRGPYRLEMLCAITFDGPLHVGTGQHLAVMTDSPILRDHNNKPYLPGSSIRGVLRDFCEREAIVLNVPRSTIVRLLGPDSIDNSKNSRRGRLTVGDAQVADSTCEIRDHVRIVPETGAALKGGKFDGEAALDIVAEFSIVYEGDSENDEELVLLSAVKKAITEDRILFFGAKSGWGFGAVKKATITSAAVHRGDPNGFIQYLQSRLPGGAPIRTDDNQLAEHSERKRDYATGGGKRIGLHPWAWLTIESELQFDGPMLVAGPFRNEDNHSDEREKADTVYISTSNGTAYLPGSALRGPMQAYARRIAETLEVRDVADSLFGSVKEETGTKGLLHIGEGCIDVKHEIYMTHVAIDRLTGFAANQKLFDTCALASPKFKHRFFVRWKPDDVIQQAAVALFLFTLRDMQEGLVWVGSRTTRGYGYLPNVKVGEVKLSNVTIEDGRYTRGPATDESLSNKNLKEWGNHEVISKLVASWHNEVTRKQKEAARG
jgi:CRISPR/Cas system CMR subunit Cmr4 (Cas7 group RAMP superfamily)